MRFIEWISLNFHELKSSESVVTLFVTAHYISWMLEERFEEKLSKINIDQIEIQEVALRDPSSALRCMAFYLSKTNRTS